ncbi:c-type cytochrome [Aurantiacibacter poecillastricola]|uniref:c-type cytochrome n=1 Tax=Aurantiacibacter poecillastricola TaxID=3064385 RepID=UPI00273EAB4C|nr:cytochrome c family protein [Aurantiacibacter sp. 219JJ12-13]MDP5260406.1 cytochrome c family protein [Aurantiacibacter sp. 219JJ12-13]
MKSMTSRLMIVAATLSLAACGGGGADEPEAPAEPEAAAPAAAEPQAAAPAEAPPPESTDTIDGTTLAEFTPDVAHGEEVFGQCQACHVLEPGQNRVGPSLAGIVGREAGTVEGFNYTPANANSGITWTPEKLFQYLENPQRVVPGTKMAFPGLSDGQDRADVIAYLEANAS